MVQYNAALMITGAFKGTSRDRIYQELGLQPLADRRWTRKLFFTKYSSDYYHLTLRTCLRFYFSQLNAHYFRHNFNAIFNPMCSCNKEPETTLPYLLRCDLYSSYRLELLNNICALSESLKNFLEERLLKILLY